MMDLHREAFREEATEMLAVLEDALLELEAEPANAELVATIFRYMHTIKGSGAMFGFDDIAAFTHEVETVFDQVRAGKVPVTRELIDLTLKARDEIRGMLDSSRSGAIADPAASGTLIHAFRSLLPENSAAVRETEQVSTAVEQVTSVNAYRIRFQPPADLFLSGSMPLRLFDELRQLGQVSVSALIDQIPSLEDIQPEQCYLSWDLVLVSSCDLNAVEDVFIFMDEGAVTIEVIADSAESDEKRIGDILLERGDISNNELETALAQQRKVGELLVESGAVSPQAVGSALVEQQQVKEISQRRQQDSGSVRVPAERLDQLVNLVGEQVTVHARLSQVAASLKMPELVSLAEEVGRLTSSLRDTILNVRMLPIGSTFSKFRRLVRDLSAELGKEIELTTEGEETELDKTVIEKLNDPMVHLIRNSIDHAIERPDARLAKGKSRQGRIHLSALHSGDSVYISISDDGAGLDKEAILAKAIERGLVAPGVELTEREIFAQIFNPGFSTAKAVTSVSGRGVGMDVVKRSIEELRGAIEVKSEAGKGTVVTIRLPLTLAIIESLLVRIGEAHFVFPLSLVDECMFLTREHIEQAHGRQIVSVRDKVIPFIRLRERFQATGTIPSHEQLVIAEIDGERIGFVVDDIIGHHQTVIKTLGNAYKQVEGVSGATILGNGSVALILDVPKLYHADLQGQGA